MSWYSSREYYEMVRVYILNDGNLRQARKMYEEESIPRLRAQGIPNATIPHGRTIMAANQRLLDYGQFTVPSHAQGCGGKPTSVEVEDKICSYFEENPEASTTKASKRFRVSRNIAWKMKHKIKENLEDE